MSLINEALKRASQVQKTRPAPQIQTPDMKPAEPSRPRSWPSWLTYVGLVFAGIVGGILIWQGFSGAKPPVTNPPAHSTPAPVAKPELAHSTPTAKTVSPTLSKTATVAPATGVAQPVTANVPLAKAAAGAQNSAYVNSDAKAVAASGVPAAPAPLVAGTPSPGVQSQSIPSPVVNAPGTPQPSPQGAAVVPAGSSPSDTPAGVRTTPPASPKIDAPASPSFPEIKLQGIFYRLSKPTVLINGQTLGVGDVIEGAKIVKIDRQSVVVEMQGQRKVVIMR
jgi:hypothetical protein